MTEHEQRLRHLLKRCDAIANSDLSFPDYRAETEFRRLIRDADLRALLADLDAARAERDRYHDALIGRHGGEPIALLSELDAERKAHEGTRANLVALIDAERAAHEATKAKLAECERKYEACKHEAQCHAQEARTANATIAECYRVCTGGTGEPGNWHGAEPVRALAERLEQCEGALNGVMGLVQLVASCDDLLSHRMADAYAYFADKRPPGAEG